MPNQSTIDAIIFNEREVNALIWRIRNGKNPSPRTLVLYREHVQALSALLEAADQQAKSEVKLGGTPKPVQWIEPYPYGQIVGVPDPIEKRKLGWRGWFKSLERYSVVPFHFSVAAE